MAKISVILPVYNVADYLPRALMSVHNQTERDIEIICVNDGSTDKSLDILKKFASIDSRVKIVDKPNGGLSSARNAGLKECESKYVCFLDSDDYFEPNACEIIFHAMEKSNADILLFGGHAWPKKEASPWLQNILTVSNKEINGFNAKLLLEEPTIPYVWRNAYRVDFIKKNNLAFDETTKIGEDTIFQMTSYPLSNKTVFISDKLYDYRVDRKNSLMTAANEKEKNMSFVNADIMEKCFVAWDKYGILKNNRRLMLKWAFHFTIAEALMIPHNEKAIAYIKEILLRFYSAEEIRSIAKTSDYGDLITAVMNDGSFDGRKGSGTKAYARYLANTTHYSYQSIMFKRIFNRYVADTLYWPLYDKVKKYLYNSPTLRSKLSSTYKWEAEDAKIRQSCLDAINKEYTNK